jgi:hypothetical protein
MNTEEARALLVQVVMEQLLKMREALEFYAAEASWQDYDAPALRDQGERARDALAAVEEVGL